MDSADLRALAKEREQRRGVPTPPPAAAAKPRGPPIAAANLTKALLLQHRSIKLGRSLGYAMMMMGTLLVLFGAGRVTFGILFLGGLGLARGGAALLHGSVLPPMLIESSTPPPSQNEMAVAATTGLFCIDGLKSLGASLSAENALALDSLAFVCTYGKKNCLTNQMYTGDLTLGKIVGLVYGKLKEGVIRC